MTEHNATQFQRLALPLIGRTLIDRHLKLVWLLPLLVITLVFSSGDASGQLLYTTFANQNPNQRFIGQINLDGSGNIAFAIPGLAEGSETQYSNNGQLIGVSGKTYAQSGANQISRNVFVFNTASNQTRQITNFTDINTGVNRLFTDPVYKSFSPDGSVLAVASQTLFITPSAPGGDIGRTLSFFRVSDGQQLGQQLMDTNFNGTSTGGDGVSWSPVADVIAIPTTTFNPVNPLASGPTPISSFNSAGQFLGNLTSPTASGLGQQFAEHDQFPSYSPDGQELAYFRQRRIGVGLGLSPTQLELRIAGVVQPILSFAPGQLPLGLSWSPDGTQLAFSVGDQLFDDIPNVGRVYRNEMDSNTASIGIANRAGGLATPFLSAPSAFPEFFPGTGTGGSCNGDFNNDGQTNIADIDFYSGNLGQPANGALAQLDLDGSGTITLADHDRLITQCVQTSAGVGTHVGDINLDGTVNVLGDAFILVSNLNTSGIASYGQGDLNADGQVNVLGDAFRLVGNLGASTAASTPTSVAVPEPAGTSLIE